MPSTSRARLRLVAVFLFVAGSLGITVAAQAQAWTAPIGIPTPSFGITEQAGATTVSVTTAQALPNPIPAGAVVVLQAGTHSRNYEGGSRLVCAGTASSPAFVRGAAGAVVSGTWEIGGSYCIFENLTFRMTGTAKGLLSLGQGGGHHLVVRDSDIAGNSAGGGGSVATYAGGAINDIVWLRNRIHDNGNWTTTEDQDVHGIVVGGGAQRVWILDNEFWHNSGDGVQVNGSITGTRFVYLGRNTVHENKQTGLWTKEAADVIFSQNVGYSFVPSPSSPGSCFGGQYGPLRVWYLFNRCSNSTIGIIMASDSDPRVTDHYYVGNIVSNVTDSGLIARGGTNITMVGNTLDKAPTGIAGQAGSKKWTIAQNIMNRITSRHIDLSAPPLSGSTRRNDLYSTTPSINGTLACTGCLTGDPRFADANNGDYTLLPASPGIDTGGALAAVYDTFQATYGIDIKRDAAGALRPQGAGFDTGAYEYASSALPSDLTIGDVTVTEGNSGSVNAVFTVAVAPATTQPVTLSFATGNATATAGSDYTATSGSLSFPIGSTTRTISVPVLGDTLVEGDETFVVTLAGVSGATVADGQGRGTIRDDDAPAAPSLGITDVSVTEGQSGTVSAIFDVRLSAAATGAVTVAYATANGTAQAGSDYDATSGTLTFPAGTTSRTVGVTVRGDVLVEPDETFVVGLTNPVGATLADGQGLGTIVNDDSGTTPGEIFVDLLLPSASCTTYNVSTRTCTGGTSRAYRTLAGAAAVALPGETVTLRVGTYAEPLVPPRSGQAGQPITYRRYASEVATITGASFDPAIDLTNRTDIVIDGLQVTDVVGWLGAVNAHRNVIRNGTFLRATAAGSRGGIKFVDSNDNRILNNTIEDGNDNLLLIHSDRNVVQANTFRRARHALWTILCGNRNVIRGNSFHNDLQKIGQVTDCEGVPSGSPQLYNATKRNLIEANTFAYTPSSGDASPYAGIQYSAQEGIIRRNIFRDTTGPGLDMTLYPDEARYNTGNRVFHNVFYKTAFAGVSLANPSRYAFFNNQFKNNVFYRSQFVANDTRWPWYTQVLAGQPIQILTGRLKGYRFERNDILGTTPAQAYAVTYGQRESTSNPPGQTLATWQQTAPQFFVNNLEVLPGFVDENARDFRLTAASPLVDAAAHLTTTTAAGSGFVVPVADVSYFYDGYGIAGEVGDVVRLQGQTVTAVVVAVDEVNRTLRLDRSLTWSAGQGVSLAFNGSAPDVGAIER